MSQMNEQSAEMNDELHEAGEDVSDSAQETANRAKNRVKEVLGEGVEQAQRAGQQVMDAVKGQYDRVGRGAKQVYRSARDTSLEWEHEIQDQIRRVPISTVLAAAGIGMVIGFVLGRETFQPPKRTFWR